MAPPSTGGSRSSADRAQRRLAGARTRDPAHASSKSLACLKQLAMPALGWWSQRPGQLGAALAETIDEADSPPPRAAQHITYCPHDGFSSQVRPMRRCPRRRPSARVTPRPRPRTRVRAPQVYELIGAVSMAVALSARVLLPPFLLSPVQATPVAGFCERCYGLPEPGLHQGPGPAPHYAANRSLSIPLTALFNASALSSVFAVQPSAAESRNLSAGAEVLIDVCTVEPPRALHLELRDGACPAGVRPEPLGSGRIGAQRFGGRTVKLTAQCVADAIAESRSASGQQTAVWLRLGSTLQAGLSPDVCPDVPEGSTERSLRSLDSSRSTTWRAVHGMLGQWPLPSYLRFVDPVLEAAAELSAKLRARRKSGLYACAHLRLGQPSAWDEYGAPSFLMQAPAAGAEADAWVRAVRKAGYGLLVASDSTAGSVALHVPVLRAFAANPERRAKTCVDTALCLMSDLLAEFPPPPAHHPLARPEARWAYHAAVTQEACAQASVLLTTKGSAFSSLIKDRFVSLRYKLARAEVLARARESKARARHKSKHADEPDGADQDSSGNGLSPASAGAALKDVLLVLATSVRSIEVVPR